jgi:hypothetical protein
VVYFIPFFASTYYGSASYGQNGLYLVYRENILRYFQPFDHQGPIYTYFIYLPVYLLPSVILFFPALFSLKSRWKNLSANSKWVVCTLTALFLFFSLSGSRRSYYVLPMIPFAILLSADWILSAANTLAKRRHWSAGLIVTTFIVLYACVDLIPEWYYSQLGVGRFAASLKTEAAKIKPWKQWNVVTLDAESKLNFYLQLPPDVTRYHIKGSARHQLLTEDQLLMLWPSLKDDQEKNTIFITRKLYVPILKNILTNYRMFEIRYIKLPFYGRHDMDTPVAFIPAIMYRTENAA